MFEANRIKNLICLGELTSEVSQMKKRTRKLHESAKASLDQMMELMAPFLPKRDIGKEQPPTKWHLSDRHAAPRKKSAAA
jgi:hypothetical protein